MSSFDSLCLVPPHSKRDWVSKDGVPPLRNHLCAYLTVWGMSLNITHFERSTLYATEHPLCTEERTLGIGYDEVGGGVERRKWAQRDTCANKRPFTPVRRCREDGGQEASPMNLCREDTICARIIAVDLYWGDLCLK